MKKIFIFTGIILLGLFIIMQPKKMETNNKNYNVYIKEGNSYVKQSSGDFPTIGYSLNTTESTCTGGGTLKETGPGKISLSMSNTEKCNLYFDKNAVGTIMDIVGDANSSSTAVITKTAPSGGGCTNTFAYDGTTDKNLRYVGSNPCNYVTYNGETGGWRIIGVMANVDDGNGNLQYRLKLMRLSGFEQYSWDASAANGYDGMNNWPGSDLQKELNGDYLDTTLAANTNWKVEGGTLPYDYTQGLGADAQKLISNAKWFLGGHNTNLATASALYTAERGTTVWGSSSGQTCNDGYCPRATEWVGKVGLIYPSDYGFAVGGSVRSTCLSTNLSSYNNNNCYTNNWIKNIYTWGYQNTLTPSSNEPSVVFKLSNSGTMDQGLVLYSDVETHPVVYLNANVAITGGNGSSSSPYTLG